MAFASIKGKLKIHSLESILYFRKSQSDIQKKLGKENSKLLLTETMDLETHKSQSPRFQATNVISA